jgi:exopolysaccharide production protein ExoZ
MSEPASRSSPRDTIFSLQWARAVAAMLVVYLHAVLQTSHESVEAATMPVFGRCGVDIFFCLSGFVMWRSTAGAKLGTMRFYARRIARIVPLYWLLTVAASLAALAAPQVFHFTKFNAEHFVASLLFVPWPHPGASAIGLSEVMAPVILPGWTLNYEMLFYALFGVLLLLPVGRRKLGLLGLFAGLTALIVGLRGESRTLAFYDPMLFSEFILGVFLADWVCARRAPRAGLLFGLAAVSLAAMIVCDALLLPVPRGVLLGVPAAMFLYALASLDLAGRWPKSRLMNLLGDASYSLYLSHVFVLAALRIGLNRALRQEFQVAHPAIYVGLAIVASAVAAVVIHVAVERPLTEWARRALDAAFAGGARRVPRERMALAIRTQLSEPARELDARAPGG